MAKIPVPKPAKQSFNPHRPISDLLRWQMKHMRAVEMALPHEHHSGINVYEVKTEAEASAYLAKVTQKLMEKVHKSLRVPVPKPPRSALNKDRRISQLLKNHVRHFHEIEKKWPAEKQTGTDVELLKTEGQAAAYISQITSNMLLQGNKKK
jgi:hypothetical protein